METKAEKKLTRIKQAITKEVIRCGQRLWGPEFKRWSCKAQLALQAVQTDVMAQVCKALSIEHWYCLQHHVSRTQ